MTTPIPSSSQVGLSLRGDNRLTLTSSSGSMAQPAASAATASPLVLSSQSGLSLRGGGSRFPFNSPLGTGAFSSSAASAASQEASVVRRDHSSTGGHALSSSPENRLGPMASPTTAFGRDQLMQSITEGIASALLADAENRYQTDIVIQQVAMQIQEARRQVDGAITEFRNASSEGNAKAKGYAFDMIGKLIDRKGVSPEEASNAKFIDELVAQVNHRFFETVKQLMDLELLNSEGKLKPIGTLMQVVFDARLGELRTLGERVKLIREQEDHELAIEVAVRNQVLKEQSIAFDQLVQSVKVDCEVKQQELEGSLKERSQKHEEKKGLIELSIAAKKAQDDKELQRAQQKYEKELEEKRIEYYKNIETKRIAAQAVTEIAGAAAQAAAPKCVIQ
ncbi:MAG: hypothetical protein KR126chlam3_00503 [Chlamydiae bacterium]|nr:hypothetical protein [Chlamydiota bacterium]